MIKFILVLQGNHPEIKSSLIKGLQTVQDKFFVRAVVSQKYNGPIKDLHDIFMDYFSQYGQTVQDKNDVVLRSVAEMGRAVYGPDAWTNLLHASLRQISAAAEPMGVVVEDLTSHDQLAQLEEFASGLGGAPVITVRLHQPLDKTLTAWKDSDFDLTIDPDKGMFHIFGPLTAAIRAKLPSEQTTPSSQSSTHQAVVALNEELKKLLAQGYGADFQWVYDTTTGCKQLKLKKLEPIVKLDKTEETRIAELTQQTLSEAQPAVPVAVPPTESKVDEAPLAAESVPNDGSGPAASEAVGDVSHDESSPGHDSGNPDTFDGSGGPASDGSVGAGLAQDVDGSNNAGSTSAVGT